MRWTWFLWQSFQLQLTATSIVNHVQNTQYSYIEGNVLHTFVSKLQIQISIRAVSLMIISVLWTDIWTVRAIQPTQLAAQIILIVIFQNHRNYFPWLAKSRSNLSIIRYHTPVDIVASAPPGTTMPPLNWRKITNENRVFSWPVSPKNDSANKYK